MPAPEIDMSEEATRRYSAYLRKGEMAQMVHCEGTWREVVALDSKAKYWGERAAHYQNCRNRPRNRLHARAALNRQQQEAFDKIAAVRDGDLEIQINVLVAQTRLRKLIQRKLGMAPTRDEYINCGDNSNLGGPFLLLNPEVDSATSVQNYMDTCMAGTSLFANEL